MMGPVACMVFAKAPHHSPAVPAAVLGSFLARATTTDPIFFATAHEGSMNELSSYRTKAEPTWGAHAVALAGRSENGSCSQSNSQRSRHFPTMITQECCPPAMVVLTQNPVSDAVAPRSSSTPAAKSSRAPVPAVFALASLALLPTIPCRGEESLRRISAGYFAAGEGEETASASDQTCEDSEMSSDQCLSSTPAR